MSLAPGHLDNLVWAFLIRNPFQRSLLLWLSQSEIYAPRIFITWVHKWDNFPPIYPMRVSSTAGCDSYWWAVHLGCQSTIPASSTESIKASDRDFYQQLQTALQGWYICCCWTYWPSCLRTDHVWTLDQRRWSVHLGKQYGCSIGAGAWASCWKLSK